ncbi:MAG: hypothetical protein VKS61_06480, partial [Candidatus Sericytochromatia bacterium]|nr:hypothetical protein [Candidatus Sericytochromatia bacterium]
HKVIFPNGLKPRAATQGAKAASGAFRITGTQWLPDGFRVEGYARVGGMTVPAKTTVTMRSVASSRGEWALRPDRIEIAGVSVPPALPAVRQAMAADSRLRADGDAFVVLLGDDAPKATLWERMKAALGRGPGTVR